MSADSPIFDLPDETATALLGRRLAEAARPGDVFALFGDLGTGKTALARAFVGALMGGAEEVPSPTFTLVQTYDAPPAPIWHFDLYRLERPEDALELGIEEAFAGSISLIEWPERLGYLLPPDRLELRLAFAGDPEAGGRKAEMGAKGAWGARFPALLKILGEEFVRA